MTKSRYSDSKTPIAPRHPSHCVPKEFEEQFAAIFGANASRHDSRSRTDKKGSRAIESGNPVSNCNEDLSNETTDL